MLSYFSRVRTCSPPGSSVHGILQARPLEWVAIPSSRGSSWPSDGTRISCDSCRQILYHWATGKPITTSEHPASIKQGELHSPERKPESRTRHSTIKGLPKNKSYRCISTHITLCTERTPRRIKCWGSGEEERLSHFVLFLYSSIFN